MAEFFAGCDGAKLAALEARWPVLSVHQMRHRERREIPVGDASDLQIVGSRSSAGDVLTVS